MKCINEKQLKANKMRELLHELHLLLQHSTKSVTMKDAEALRQRTGACKKKELEQYVKQYFLVDGMGYITGERKAKTKQDLNFQPKNIQQTYIPEWVKNTPTKKELKQRNAISHVIYRFLDKDGKIIYVGRAKNLENRLYKHGQNGHLPVKCYKQVAKIEFTRFTSEDDLDLAEPYYIAKWKPEFNQDFKNKNYSFAIELLETKAWENYKHVEMVKKHVA